MSTYTVGQTVIVTYQFDKVPEEGTVTQVARKYVSVGTRKFDMATGAERIRGGYLGGKIYTLEAWAELTSCNALVRELRRLGVELTGRAASLTSLTSHDLRDIRDIAAKQPR